MAITSLESMKEYIKRKLGAPISVVPITDAQFDDIIGDCGDVFSRYNYGSDSTYRDFIVIDAQKGVVDYDLSGQFIQEVFDLDYSLGSSTRGLSNMFSPINSLFYNDWVLMGNSPGSGGGELNLTHYQIQMDNVEQLQRYFSKEYFGYWDSSSEILKIVPTPDEDMKMMAHVYKRKETSNMYNNILFKDLCVAKAMIQWSINVGKYDIETPGGGKVNYERIGQMGMDLEEKTMLKISLESEPIDFFIG